MGVCYNLYCHDCKEYFDIGKKSNSKFFVPRILKNHKQHKLSIFDDCIVCKYESDYKNYKRIDMDNEFDNDNLENIENFTDKEIEEFFKSNWHKCDACQRCY